MGGPCLIRTFDFSEVNDFQMKFKNEYECCQTDTGPALSTRQHHPTSATAPTPSTGAVVSCRGTHYPDSDWWQYSRTKLMNLMTGKEMARRLAGTGVEVSRMSHKWFVGRSPANKQ